MQLTASTHMVPMCCAETLQSLWRGYGQDAAEGSPGEAAYDTWTMPRTTQVSNAFSFSLPHDLTLETLISVTHPCDSDSEQLSPWFWLFIELSWRAHVHLLACPQLLASTRLPYSMRLCQ